MNSGDWLQGAMTSNLHGGLHTHLSPLIPDEAVAVFSAFYADRDFEAVGKLRGGGLLFFVNNRWSWDMSASPTRLHGH